MVDRRAGLVGFGVAALAIAGCQASSGSSEPSGSSAHTPATITASQLIEKPLLC